MGYCFSSKWIRKGVYFSRRHPKLTCIGTLQVVIIMLYYTKTHRAGQQNHQVDARRVHSRQISEVKSRDGANGAGNSGKLHEEAHDCNMEKYLSSSQEVCTHVLNTVNILNDWQVPDDTLDYVKYPSCDLEIVQNSCKMLRKAYMFGKEQLTQEEMVFPLAFAIKIHTFPNQAHRLLRFIYREHNVYCIHIDKKAKDHVYKSFKNIQRCFDNVIVIDDRVNVIYSSIRQIEAELRCMRAVKTTKHRWKYYINLTGQEFMVKTNLELVRYLHSLNGSNDIESYEVPANMVHRFKQKALFIRDSVIVSKQKKEPFSKDIQLRKGSAYGLFTRDFVNFVLNYPLVREFLVWLQDSYAPEETIWATINALPEAPGGSLSIRHSKYQARAVKWQLSQSIDTCHGKYIHWICIYGVGDLPWLLGNRNMVANKFYEHYQPLALTCLESAMYQRLMNT